MVGFKCGAFLGSAITEPAAMTIAALMLAPQVFHTKVLELIKYFALGVCCLSMFRLVAP